MASNTTQLTIKINGLEVEHTMKGLGKEIGNIKKELKELNASDPNFKTKQAELQKQLKDTRGEYDKLKTAIYGANNATDNYVKGINKSSGASSMFKNGLAGVGAGIAAAFTIDKVLELGKAIYDNVERVRELKTELSAISGLDGVELRNATTGTMGLADTYKVESKEVMLAANAMSKQLKISYADALAEIKRGFQEGANASGDMLNQIKEYAPFIKEIGGDTKDFVNIIKSGMIDGVWNDKAIDAVKEFSLRFREMTTTTRDALVNLGLNVDDMQRKIASGQMTYMDAMMQVSKEMSKLGNNSMVTGQVLADVFGGPGEDAGFAYIANLHKMNDGVSNLTHAQLEFNRVKAIELEANEKSAMLFEALTGEGSKLNEFLANGKLALVDFTAALFGIEQARASDDIRDQQVALRLLQSELLSTNVTTERRKQILNDLQALYPSIFSNLDLEVATNEQLSSAIDKVNDSLSNKYQLQKINEGVEDAAKDSADANLDLAEAKIKLKEEISRLASEYSIKIPVEIQQKSLIEQSAWLENQLSGKTKNFSFELKSLEGATKMLTWAVRDAGEYAEELKKAEQHAAKLKEHMFGISPLQQKANETISNLSDNLTNILNGRINQLENGASNADAGRADEIKQQARDAAAAQKRAESERAREAKRNAEQLKRERESLHKELLKAEEDFQKKLKSARTAEEQATIDLMKNGIEKELEIIRFGKDQKIQGLNDEIKELEKLQKEFQDKANRADKLGSKDDAKKFRDLAKEQVDIIVSKNATIFSIEEKSAADSLIVYSKYRGKEIEMRQKAHDDLIKNIQTQQNEELAQATTLEEAKEILRSKYGVEQLNHITTISDARNEIMKEQNKKMLDEQLNAFEVELQEIIQLLNDDAFARENGLQILTDEDRDKQIENLKQLGLAISEVKVAISGEKALSDDEKAARNENVRKELRSGLDILGFSADDWATAFEGLEKAQPGLEKLGAALKLTEMALQSVSNAWGMMVDAQNSALERQVKKYEASADKKSNALKKQLDEGYISQETYNAQIEALEEDLAARKSEISYKQAMNDWRFQLMNGIANTALGVTKALASTPPPGNFALAALVGGLGAVQTGVIMANKPNRAFYNVGGRTTSLGYTDETGHEVAGVVHANEYVVPEWMHQIPVVANMVEFMEAIRTGGGAVASNATSSYAEGGAVTPTENKSAVNDLSIVSSVIDQFNQNLQLNNQLLEHLISNGVELQMDMKSAQRLNHQLDKTKKYISQAKKS